MGKGWHGIRDPAIAQGAGRSGGTSVFARRPTQIVRGGSVASGTIAVISWAVGNRLHSGPFARPRTSGDH